MSNVDHDNAAPKLSARAVSLLERVRSGRFYPVDGKVPQAMAELEAAGLVGTAGRAVQFVRCYVPATGYTPHVLESFGAEKEA
jgi:hypothetical protein